MKYTSAALRLAISVVCLAVASLDCYAAVMEDILIDANDEALQAFSVGDVESAYKKLESVYRDRKDIEDPETMAIVLYNFGVVIEAYAESPYEPYDIYLESIATFPDMQEAANRAFALASKVEPDIGGHPLTDSFFPLLLSQEKYKWADHFLRELLDDDNWKKSNSPVFVNLLYVMIEYWTQKPLKPSEYYDDEDGAAQSWSDLVEALRSQKQVYHNQYDKRIRGMLRLAAEAYDPERLGYFGLSNYQALRHDYRFWKRQREDFEAFASFLLSVGQGFAAEEELFPTRKDGSNALGRFWLAWALSPYEAETTLSLIGLFDDASRSEALWSSYSREWGILVKQYETTYYNPKRASFAKQDWLGQFRADRLIGNILAAIKPASDVNESVLWWERSANALTQYNFNREEKQVLAPQLYFQLGDIYQNDGSISKAREFYLEGVAQLSQLGDHDSIAYYTSVLEKLEPEIDLRKTNAQAGRNFAR